jgi:DNA-binding MarR family transcriptional regulator
MITTSMWPAVSTRHGWSSTISRQTALQAARVDARARPSPESGCKLTQHVDNVHMHRYSGNVRKATNLDLCNCFATRQAARHVTRLYERHLAGAEVTSAQYSILVLLDEQRGMTMNELAAALVMDRTTLLRALKPLQRDGLVNSKRSESDPRQLILALSAAGQRKLKEAARLWQRAQTEFETQVGSARAARMRSDLLALARPA